MAEKQTAPVLVADIGGTNSRFALVDSDGRLGAPVRVEVADHETLADALRTEALPALGAAPRSAMMALAAVIEGDRPKLTNAPWVIDPKHLMTEFGWDQVTLLNDFEALSLSLPYLAEGDVAPIGGGTHQPLDTKLVVGPGTGLGVAALIPVDGRWLPISTEAGHADIGPIDRRDFEIWPHIAPAADRISGETLISGPGIERLYRAIARANGTEPAPRPASEIVALADARDDTAAVETMERFVTYLGRFAGNYALIFLARGGIYLGGGIAPRIQRHLARGGFRRAFENKRPFGSLLESTATSVITEPEPALSGLAALVRDPAQFAIDLSSRRWRR